MRIRSRTLNYTLNIHMGTARNEHWFWCQYFWKLIFFLQNFLLFFNYLPVLTLRNVIYFNYKFAQWMSYHTQTHTRYTECYMEIKWGKSSIDICRFFDFFHSLLFSFEIFFFFDFFFGNTNNCSLSNKYSFHCTNIDMRIHFYPVLCVYPFRLPCIGILLIHIGLHKLLQITSPHLNIFSFFSLLLTLSHVYDSHKWITV